MSMMPGLIGMRDGFARALAASPLGRMSHDAARRTWWLALDGAPGALRRARLHRHLAECGICRAELDPALVARALRIAAPPVVPVSPRLVARLRTAAADRLGDALRAERRAQSERWTRRLVGGVAAACAIGFAVAVTLPRVFERTDELVRIDARLDSLEADLVGTADTTAVPALHATLDDSLGGLESVIRCLRADDDDGPWNLESLGGEPCADS